MSSARSRRAWILLLLLPVSALAAILIGRYGPDLVSALRALLSLGEFDENLRTLILRVRLPRMLAAACIGANLAVSGTVFQSLFRNPLVDSRILGVSSGAAFGAALALLLSLGTLGLQSMAFAFALVAVGLVLLVGRQFGSAPLILVVGGILISALFQALLGLLKYVADPLSKLPAITYWLLGGLTSVRWATVGPLLGISLIGLLFFLAIRWRLDALTLPENEAAALGVRVRELRALALGIGTLLIAASVAVGGIIGWIGLVVPHLARAWIGPEHSRSIPVALGVGALSVILLDTVARTVLPSEIPLGILTGLLGVPAFFVLFIRFMHTRGEPR